MPSLPFLPLRTQQDAGYEPGKGPSSEHHHAASLILGFPVARNVRNTCLPFVRGTVHGLLQQREWTKKTVRFITQTQASPSSVLRVIIFLVREREAYTSGR